jgi:hypothetical protein
MTIGKKLRAATSTSSRRIRESRHPIEMKPVYFIRHKWHQELHGVAEELARQELVGLIYQNIPSTNPEDYQNRRQASSIRRLRDLATQDVLVCADYPQSKERPYMLIGALDPAFGFKVEERRCTAGLPWQVKLAKFKNPLRVYYDSFPSLKASWPLGGSISEWRAKQSVVNQLASDGMLRREVSSLAPEQAEALCTSYLFDTGQLAFIGLPSGRTLKDWDIWGISKDGKNVVAQVTFSMNTGKLLSKAAVLKATVDSSARLIFFAPESERTKIHDAEFISLEDVWNHFVTEYGPNVTDHLLGKGAVYPNSKWSSVAL